LCLASAAWGVVVVAAGLWFPSYLGAVETCAPGAGGPCTSTTTRESTATLVQVNGPSVLPWLFVPLVASLLVAVFVLVGRRGAALARGLAWAVAVGLGMVALVAGASIGLWFAPSFVALVLALAFTARGPGGGRYSAA
jgi:hypothetical protein